jgi:ribonuclease-3
LQSIAPQSPKNSITSQLGPEHSKHFTAAVTWQGVELGRGEGPSKKEAHFAAALDSLQRESWKALEVKPDGAEEGAQ